MSATTAVEMPEIGATGLTSKEVAQRIESGQSNAVKTSTSRSVQDIVRANVFTLFNGIIFATRMESLSNVRLALSSVTMPMPVLMMMTKPNTASLQEPVISTNTIAAKMMPLNSVNTVARPIS